jgi:hypothetical protein
MQRGAMAEKKKILFDGKEVAGLVLLSEIILERGMIDVPEFSRKRKIQDGITTIPAVDLTYKVERNSDTLKFFRDYYNNDEVKDVIIVRTDAHGVEFARTLLTMCECNKYQEPQFDGANVTYAQINVRIVPWDITAQGK